MEEKNYPERSPIKKVRLVDLTVGKYFPGSREEMKSGFLITTFGERMTRVAVCGAVIDRYDSPEGKFSSITIDDGTDAIRVKAFAEGMKLLEKIKIGSTVIVVGKIKNYGDENFITPEGVKEISDSNMDTLWKLERMKSLIERKKTVDEIKRMRSQMEMDELIEYAKGQFGMDEESIKFVLEGSREEVDYKPRILELIEKYDEGQGVEIAKLLELSKLDESIAESAISDLMTQGMLYEPTVGKLRKV